MQTGNHRLDRRGMSWESSALYYRIINREMRACLSGVAFPLSACTITPSISALTSSVFRLC